MSDRGAGRSTRSLRPCDSALLAQESGRPLSRAMKDVQGALSAFEARVGFGVAVHHAEVMAAAGASERRVRRR